MHDDASLLLLFRPLSNTPLNDLHSMHITPTSQQREDLISGINSFYLIYAGALVYFMQLGFAMLCAGSIREKNVKNVLLWNLLDSAGGAFGFWSIGYAFAYGGDDATSSQKTFIGNTGFFLMGDTDMEFWFFQFAFACALSSIVAGTIAERCQMMVSLFIIISLLLPLRLILDPLSTSILLFSLLLLITRCCLLVL